MGSAHGHTHTGRTHAYRHAQQQHHYQSPTSVISHSGQGRTAPEVLKTLLRKKACLFEAGTSRAIAMITWLVGRKLGIEMGYFSRQQLQQGVHQVVSANIESGDITRTKVNRCMQIILNSCFHYIIPRPDGVETGTRFRRMFAEEAIDDSRLLRMLPPPWDNVDVEASLAAFCSGDDNNSQEELPSNDNGNATPHNLSKRGSHRRTPPSAATSVMELQDNDNDEIGAGNSKRTVLLCFNENVRSFEDIFRCHNEFIRDVANTANLDLTAEEWREFFLGTTSAQLTYNTDSSSEEGLFPLSPPHQSIQTDEANSPRIPALSLSMVQPVSPLSKDNFSDGDDLADREVCERHGAMSVVELNTFRTSWCAKRYDHNPNLCAFAHVDVNRGWLRRNPNIYQYRDEMCPNVITIPEDSGQPTFEGRSFNSCPKGINCEFCHSQEELYYHANRYKKHICPMISKKKPVATEGKFKEKSRAMNSCELRDVCPFVHLHPPQEQAKQGDHWRANTRGSQLQSSKSGNATRGGLGDSSGHNPLTSQHFTQRGNLSHFASSGVTTGAYSIPHIAPMMYISPAPESEFEKSLRLPGLKSLFRRHCSILHSHFQGRTEGFCVYENFGDDLKFSSSK